MSELVIRASNLTKIYRLYERPHQRFLHMLGLLSKRKSGFTEHAALAGIDMEVRRGEKVAIIGRNGAGKSTLLKLISNVIEPTSGSLEVHGNARALLQIGSGFHPDFTGRENVYGYLAYLGVTGARADDLFSGIVEFSELEEYIEQPLKTYSTGMAVRLMFSTSTAIAPDILVLDEVLSVGDAYFSHKSFARISELSERNGTTLLLVTHDIYSASKLCPRMLWMDHGKILMDGDGATVIKGYEDSIRDQEEKRFRLRKQNRLREIARNAPAVNLTHLLIEIRSRNNLPPPEPIYFSAIELLHEGRVIASLPIESSGSDSAGSHLQFEGCSWGEAVEWNGRHCRPMAHFGAPFHKVAGVLAIPDRIDMETIELELRLQCRTKITSDLLLRAFYQGRQYDLGKLKMTQDAWSICTTPVQLGMMASVSLAETFIQDVSLSGMHGSGLVVIRDIVLLDEFGHDAHIVTHGTAVSFEIQYSIRDREFRGKAQVLLAMHRDGIQDVCRYIARDLVFDGRFKEGTIRLNIARLGLANGEYAVTVMIVKDGYFDRDQTLFYSINPDVYVSAGRMMEFKVTGGGVIGTGTGIVAEGAWSIEASKLEEADETRQPAGNRTDRFSELHRP